MTRSKFPIKTEAHRVIEELNLSAGQLAIVANCSKTNAQKWRNGLTIPDQDRQIVLETRWPELHRNTWVQPPKWPTTDNPGEPDHSPPPKPPVEATEPKGFIDARTSARQHLADVQRMISEARESERTGDVMKLMDLERRAIVDLAKFSGELTATEESKLTHTQRWKEVREVITKAIVPYPDAAKALIEALEGIDA